MKPLNYQSLHALKKYLCGMYGTTIRYKPNASEMKALAVLLDAIGVADHDVWLRSYSTTLGHTIYLCRRLSDTRIRARDHAVILAHEHAHVWLMDEASSPAAYNSAYLDSARRAVIEARCYAMGAAVYWRATGAVNHGVGLLPDIDVGELLIEAYRCRTKDAMAGAAVYNSICRTIVRGGIPEGPAQDVARFYGWVA